MKPCLASFRKNTSDIAEHRTMDLGSSTLAILLMFFLDVSHICQDVNCVSGIVTHLVCIWVVDFVKLLIRS